MSESHAGEARSFPAHALLRRRPWTTYQNRAAVRGILVRMPNWLGDALMATPFLDALHRRFPHAPIHLILPPSLQGLPLTPRGQIFLQPSDPKQRRRLIRSLRALQCSHFFVLPPSFSSAWQAFRVGTPYRIGYRGDGRRFLLRPALIPPHPPRSQHLSRTYLELLQPWLQAPLPQHPPPLQLRLTPAWIAKHWPADLPRRPYTVLAPGAKYGPAKNWPAEHYVALARSLAARHPTARQPLCVVGLASERALGEAIVQAAAGSINLCGRTSLEGLIALLAEARLLISNDSGTMHLAAALQPPQIALFGSTNPQWTGPNQPNARVINLHLDCAPCYARRCPLGHTACLTQITPARVLAEVERLCPPSPTPKESA